MTKHIVETDLALYVSADLGMFERARVGFHISRCERCRQRLEVYRADRAEIRKIAAEMPPEVRADADWDRLAAEMTANIRVGLAAGECVAPRKRKAVAAAWRPAAAMAALALVLASAWWLNMPPSSTQALGRAFSAVWHGRTGTGIAAGVNEERGVVVEATSSGIELRDNGNTLGVSQGASRPVAVSVSMQASQGSASARYVNADTGQMTITSVYAQ